MFKKLLVSSLFVTFCGLILTFSLRGIQGNPTSQQLNNRQWKDEGPLELSPDRGRFALTYSIIEDKSFHFSIPVAKFAIPDLGYSNGNYVSLFAPGVSYLIIPGYILGKSLGLSQVGAFAVIAFFALLNVILLRAIAIRLGVSRIPAILAPLVFIFASPAFAYAVTLYQHHISTFLILSSIYVLLCFKNIWSLLLIWFLCAASIPVDYPNLFLMFPIGVYALGRFIYSKKDEIALKLNINLLGFLTFVSALLPIMFFLYFNKMSYDNPLQLSGTVASVKEIDENGRPVAPKQISTEKIETFTKSKTQNKSAIRFFKSRSILSGLNIHLLSPDRGIIFYSPVILLGIIGAIIAYRQKMQIFSVLVGIISTNILLYSMWGDPYGGWAFGSRYLVPSYAIMAIFLGIALTSLRKNLIFLVLFFLFAIYSIAINTLGAITTSRIPPKVEAVELSKLSGVEEKYTYARNFDYLADNRSKSFLFQSYAGYHMNAFEYYLIIASSITIVFVAMISMLYLQKERRDNA